MGGNIEAPASSNSAVKSTRCYSVEEPSFDFQKLVLTAACNFRGSDALLWPPWVIAYVWCIHIGHIHIRVKKSFCGLLTLLVRVATAICIFCFLISKYIRALRDGSLHSSSSRKAWTLGTVGRHLPPEWI